MQMVSEAIIIGGGSSIKAHFSELQLILDTKFVIACNYAYKHFPHTFTTFIDRDFYHPREEANNPDIYEELKKEPLIVGINLNGIKEFKLDNTILLGNEYRKNLTGTFTLKVLDNIMKSGSIYLLGFDWNRRNNLPERDTNYNRYSDLQIHYYNDIKHRGIGLMGYYENHNPDKEFLEFTKKRDIKIYNVSLESNINCFEKISYEQMFALLNKEKYNQEELRTCVKTHLSTVR